MTTTPSRETLPPDSPDKVHLLDLLLVLSRHRNLVVGLTALFAVGSVIGALLLTPVYTATAYVVPVQPSQTGGMAAALGQLNLGALGPALAAGNNSQLFVRILTSRTVAERVVKRFDLMKLYEAETMAQATLALSKRLDVLNDKTGVISVSVDDEHPTRAADMANFFVDQLLAVTRDLALTEASQRRRFFEAQLRSARQALHQAESELKAFQVRSGVVSLEEQGRATLEMIARLQAQITAKEIQLRVLRTTATDENPIVAQLLQQLFGLRAEYERLMSMENRQSARGLGKLSASSLDYAQRWREVKYSEQVLEILGRQFELARLDEARDAPVVQVLDQAVTPEIASWPRKKILVVLGTFAGLLLGVLSAFVIDAVNRIKANPAHVSKLAEIGGNVLRRR